MNYNLKLLILLLTFTSFSAKAQYEELRFLQEDAEVKKFKSLRVAAEKKYALDSGKKILRSTRIFDTNGRMVYLKSPYNRQTFEYNTHQQIISFIDSAQGTDEFFRRDYEFEYRGDKVSFSRTYDYNSTYTWDAQKHILSESALVGFDEYQRRYFFFDNRNKLILKEDFRHSDGTPERKRIVQYTPDDKPLREVLWKYFTGGSYDSIVTTFLFDEKTKFLSKKTIYTTSYSAADSVPPRVGYRKKTEDTTSYTYTYNALGNKLTQEFYYSIPGYNNRYEWHYNQDGLLQEELFFNYKGINTNTYKYEYVIRKKKRK
ncbi:MAG: hypothetical protein NTX03_03720 [Bacteroidetes bacterium]|nr:hypothetical protein [Bacteroidota bacterium]